MKGVIRNDQGFTIQELLVALNVGFLLVSFSLALFIMSSRMLSSWQERTNIKRVVHLAVHRISIESERATVLETSGDSLIAMIAPRRTDVWQLGERVIRRSGDSLSQAEMMSGKVYRTGEALEIVVKAFGKQFDYEQRTLVGPNRDAKSLFCNPSSFPFAEIGQGGNGLILGGG